MIIEINVNYTNCLEHKKTAMLNQRGNVFEVKRGEIFSGCHLKT
jgi:hypothetical protein